MRKLLFLFVCFIAAELPAQVFQAGDVFIGAANGVAVYHLKASDTAGYNSSDAQGGINLMVRAEYGLCNWLGVELSCSSTGLITETFFTDDRCGMVEIGSGVNYHVPWKNKWIDMGGGIGAGYQRYYFRSAGISANHTRADCFLFFAGINPRLYFTKRHHFGGNLYYRFSLSAGSGEHVDSGNPQFDFSLTSYGHSFGLGFFYRFGEPYAENTEAGNSQ